MKKILAFLLLMSVASFLHAQTIQRLTPRKDSIVNAGTKYLTWPSTANGLTGVSLTVVRASGFTVGSATMERRIDTLPGSVNTWATVGNTFTFTNTSAGIAYVWPITPQDGNGYRIKVVTTDSTQKLYLYGALLRR